MAYVMWSRDGVLDSAAVTWYQPNHFIPIFRVPHCTHSNLVMPGDCQHVIESNPSPDRDISFQRLIYRQKSQSREQRMK